MSTASATLICIFSHNNAVLLRNCVRSIDRFSPGCDILILDDASTEPAVTPLLDELGKRPTVSVLRNYMKLGDPARAFVLDGETIGIDKPIAMLKETERTRLISGCHPQTDAPAANRHGYFYLNQKLALRLALSRGYKWAWFIEDDMQLVRDSSDCLSRIQETFDAEETICQIASQFLLRPGRYDFETLAKQGVYQPNRRYNSNGVFDLGRLRERPELVDAIADDVPEGNLRMTSHRWDRLGAACWFDAFPVQAHVPWPHLLRTGAQVLDERLAIQPMTEGELDAMLKRDVTIPPFAEYFLSLSYPTQLPGPPWWYNEAFTERFLDLCQEEDALADRKGMDVVHFPQGDAKQPKANYWSPPAQPADLQTAQEAPPARLRDRLRWVPGLTFGFRVYKNIRRKAKRFTYRKFHRRVVSERRRVLSREV